MKKTLANKKVSLLPVKYVWSVLASSSSVDKQTNNLSLYNLLEELSLLKSEVAQKQKEAKGAFLPVVFPFQLVTLWERAETGAIEAQAKIQLVDPEGKILTDAIYGFKIEAQQERNRFIANFNAFPFTREGIYEFRTLLKKGDEFIQVGSVSFRVKLTEKI